MVDKTIATINSASPAAALDGTELIYGTQSGGDVGITTAKIKTLAVGTPGAGKVLAGATPDFTSTPTLGASGTLGSVTFGNATSGTINLQPVTGALGAVTLSLPAATDTLIGKNTTDILTNKTLTSPVMTGPALGTPVSGVATNLTGTASGLTAGNVTTNANLTGVITSVGNATSIGSQTGTGSVFVTQASPTITTPVINGATSSGSTSLNFSGNSGTFLTSTGINTIGGELDLAAGTTAIAPLKFASGTNLTSAVAGGCEFDGVQFYETIDTSSGRGAVPAEQYFHLTSNGSAITTIANVFGTTSNIALVASAYYIIDIYMWFVTTGTGATTYTLTNSAAPTSQNILYEMSPVTGIVAPPGTATMLVGQILNDATAARTIVTGSLSAATHYAHIKIWLKNGTGTSLKIQATAASTNTTPQIGSFWHARRISPNNIGTFAA